MRRLFNGRGRIIYRSVVPSRTTAIFTQDHCVEDIAVVTACKSLVNADIG
jgi:hypothetical protein